MHVYQVDFLSGITGNISNVGGFIVGGLLAREFDGTDAIECIAESCDKSNAVQEFEGISCNEGGCDAV